MAYDQIEPLSDPWYQAGVVASTMVNLWSKSRVSPEDFVPRVRFARRQSRAEQAAIFGGIMAAQNARVASMKRTA